MRPILFHIPLDQPWDLGPLGRVPGFGFGLVLALWTIASIWLALNHLKANGWKLNRSDAYRLIARWAAVAGVIAYGAPAFGQYLRNHGQPAFRDGLPIFGYGLMLFIGVIAAVFLAAARAEKVGLSGELIWDLSMWLFVPGIIGARMFYLIQYGDNVFRDLPYWKWPLAAVNLPEGGIILYGALFGGAAGYFAFCHFRGIRPLGLADLVVPSVFVGIGFGRIGCFLYGCCFGRFTTLPWGVQFPRESSAFSSLVEKHLIDGNLICTPPLHPTQIYSSIDGFMIALITSWYFWRRRRNGEVLAVAMIIYPITRFCMELIRADEVGQFGTTLTISQWFSIAIFLFNIPYMIYLSRLPAVREPIALPQEPGQPANRTVASAAR